MAHTADRLSSFVQSNALTMASTEDILNAARNVSTKDLDNFFDKILKTTNDINNLRQLFLLMHSTHFERRLPNDVAYALLAMICDSTDFSNTAQLCSLILQESSPLKSLQLDETILGLENKSLVNLLQLLLLQSPDNWSNEKVTTKILKCMEKNKINGHDPMKVIAYISHLSVSLTFFFTQEQVDYINKYFTEILCYTTAFQAPNPNSNKLFRRSESKLHVTELDGVECREYFTILNLAQYYSDDQFANLSAFSTLRGWLNANVVRFKDPLAIPASMTLLLSSVRNYCARLTEQCERRTLRKTDASLQNMCILECVYILDLICKLNPNETASVFTTIKRIHKNYIEISTRNAEKDVILIALVQFVLRHGHTIAYDFNTMLEDVLKGVIGSNYHNITVAFEIVQFLLNNLDLLNEKDSLVIQYFPHILRLLAWHPRTFFEDFLIILPSFVTPTLAVEIFHSIIDLPCLAASLVYSQTYSSLDAPMWAQNFTVQPYKPMFAFMLRQNSGIGESFNGLEKFHELILNLSNNPHVKNCVDLVPKFLRNFFKVILTFPETQFLIRLIPSILERVRLILNIPGYVSKILSVLSDNIILLFKLRPSLILEAMADLLDFIANVRNFEKCPQFYIHIGWIIGEYTSTNHVSDCTPKVITTYYDIIECVLHEVLSEITPHSLLPQLFTTLSTTCAKLSTRSQDLLARATLTLTKISQQISLSNVVIGSENEIIVDRINMLLCVLQMPLAASYVLNPPSECLDGKYHRESISLPVVLKTLSSLDIQKTD